MFDELGPRLCLSALGNDTVMAKTMTSCLPKERLVSMNALLYMRRSSATRCESKLALDSRAVESGRYKGPVSEE